MTLFEESSEMFLKRDGKMKISYFFTKYFLLPVIREAFNKTKIF
jgi:hypothetical protein